MTAASAEPAMAEGRQFDGRSSSSRCAGWVAMRERTSASQACGSTPFILAVTMRLYMTAARWELWSKVGDGVDQEGGISWG